jgi:CRP/FNR family transcriptional regulator, cyclic AMP receptor protein
MESQTHVLRHLRFSASLPEDLLSKLASFATIAEFPAGSILFREGGANERLMVISGGCVALGMRVPGRTETRILTLGPGDMLAWSALLGAGQMTTSAIAVEDTQVVSFAAADVLELCEANHLLGYHLMRQMSHALADRLVATRLQLLDLFSESGPAISLEAATD